MSRASAGGAWTLCRLQRRHLSSASGSVSIFPQHIRTWKEMLQWTYPTQFLYLNATQSLLWNWVTSRSESNFSGGLNYMLGLRLSHQGAVLRWQAKQLPQFSRICTKGADTIVRNVVMWGMSNGERKCVSIGESGDIVSVRGRGSSESNMPKHRSWKSKDLPPLIKAFVRHNLLLSRKVCKQLQAKLLCYCSEIS
ncbi:hypothetical protein BDA96_08G157600 [Sorghum bicolor]|uniref:Uncharacterized protein n=1 Tax=Sorghum bicolor TaxID=4558 RepID=A0A921QJ12_SORBI|nr:hypothetical protein BDA96_08G157600 [Sorghum bicolor]